MMMLRSPSRVVAAAAVAFTLLAATAVTAQFGLGRFGFQPRLATAADHDGAFHFCRAWFRGSLLGDGGDWSVDYPQADLNLSIRLAELTRTAVSRGSDNRPNHLIVRLTDDELFQCPFVMMTEVGSIALDDREVDRLREYLFKGGFLWVDDFWGTYAWNVWVDQIRKVFPPSDYPIIDLPVDHALYQTQFVVTQTPQIPNIGFWLSTGTTSERGPDSADVHTRAITDRSGRVMVLMTHNTDLGDSWEREAEDPTYFYQFAANGYAFGINVVLYALTH
ncbi:MAG: DUF4159 domain-containing protein [Acidobacteria bacterium]|nr:DUF4159 domain-containing protein [Acidobacteriota bacterium]